MLNEHASKKRHLFGKKISKELTPEQLAEIFKRADELHFQGKLSKRDSIKRPETTTAVVSQCWEVYVIEEGTHKDTYGLFNSLTSVLNFLKYELYHNENVRVNKKDPLHVHHSVFVDEEEKPVYVQCCDICSVNKE